MTLRKGLPVKLGATDADDTRYDFRNLVVCNSDGSPRGGVTSPIGVALVTATSSMNVSVAAFSGVAVRDGGVVLLSNDGPTSVLLANAPVSNSRLDVIYAKQNDASATVTSPDANNNAVLGVAQGTASASPAKPAIPDGALELATVQIPSTATATNSAGVVFTQTAAFTAAPRGEVVVRSITERNAWTTAQLDQVVRILNGESYIWRGANGWQLHTVYARYVGPSAVSTLSGTASNILTVTFPTGRFSVPPNVSPYLMSSPGTGRKLLAQATGITVGGCQIVVTSGDQSAVSSSVSVGFTAEQATSTSASG